MKMTMLIVSLYSLVVIVACLLLYRWHSDPAYKNFSVVDLIAENGRLSSRKFMEFGAWVVASIAVVVSVLRNSMSSEVLLIYLGSFVAARSMGQWMNLRSDTEVRKASIMKGGPPIVERRSEPRVERNATSTVEEDLARIAEERATVKAQGR
jgi:hypothetical protein